MSSSTPPPAPTLVNIGTHSLALYAHGPEPSNAKEPVVLYITGLATSSLVWSAVTRLLPPSLRIYNYDRSGYGNSEPSPRAPTAENIALELSLLIEKAHIVNPLIIVGHSWGGVISREFVVRNGNGPQIAGLVLVDANHETTLEVLNWMDGDLQAIFEGVDQFVGKGIEAEHKLTPAEWDAYVRDEATEGFAKQEEKEFKEYPPSFETLRRKNLAQRQPLFGDKPVYVIGGMWSRDWSGLYKSGVAKGNGTEEQRSHAREMIRTADEKNEGLMKEHLKLSTKAKLVFAYESGHFVQLTQPDIVVDGVKWVLDEL